jgi:uncharacterized protein (TIGR00730 family)
VARCCRGALQRVAVLLRRMASKEGKMTAFLHENPAARRKIQRLCVFCGSSSGSRPIYAEAASRLGQELAKQNVALVFGGGCVGLMGILADSVLGARGQAIGVIPKALVEKEIAHKSLTKLHIVGSMHERKARMADLADAFALLPGGYGSWEEFLEVATWLQLGIHQKPCAILNVAGYYDALLSLSSHALAEGFLRAAHKDMLIVEGDPAHLLARLAAAEVPAEPKWVSRQGR